MAEQNEQVIKSFLDVKIANDLSPETIKNQRFLLNHLKEFLKGKPFQETTEKDIFAFLAYKRENGLSSGSLHSYKVVIKSFYRFLYNLPKNQYPKQVRKLNGGNNRRKVPIRPEDVITKEDIAMLIKHCTNYRDEALVIVLYESGCRLGEFVNINIGHLKFDKKGVVAVIGGKTGERRIRLIESTVYLQRWIENHPLRDNKDTPLWCSLRRPHQRITRSNVHYFLAGLKKRSGFKKPLNAHAFRHSRLTELAKWLVPSKLRQFAGWSSIEMCNVYVHLSGRDLDDDLFRAAGIQVEKKTEVSPLLKLECPRCGTKNPVNNTFCGLCGLVLDETKAVSQEFDQEKLKNEIEELKDKYETAGEITDQLWREIDELTKEIKELKKQQ
jgi:integrase/recombinase XerD